MSIYIQETVIRQYTLGVILLIIKIMYASIYTWKKSALYRKLEPPAYPYSSFFLFFFYKKTGPYGDKIFRHYSSPLLSQFYPISIKLYVILTW